MNHSKIFLKLFENFSRELVASCLPVREASSRRRKSPHPGARPPGCRAGRRRAGAALWRAAKAEGLAH